MKLTRSKRKLCGSLILRKMFAWKIKTRKLDQNAHRWVDLGWKEVFSDGVNLFEENKDTPLGQFKEQHDWWYFFHEHYTKLYPDLSVQMHDMLPISYDQSVKLNRDHPWVKEVL